MRGMRKLPESCCSTYMQFSVALIAGIYLSAMGKDFRFMVEFSVYMWILLIASSATTLLQQLTKYYAFKYSPVPPLMKYNFLPNVWQFFIDLLILHNHFSVVQLLGFASLGLIYGGQMVKGWIEQCTQKGEEEEISEEAEQKIIAKMSSVHPE